MTAASGGDGDSGDQPVDTESVRPLADQPRTPVFPAMTLQNARRSLKTAQNNARPRLLYHFFTEPVLGVIDGGPLRKKSAARQ